MSKRPISGRRKYLKLLIGGLGILIFCLGGMTAYGQTSRYKTEVNHSPDGKYTWYTVTGDPLKARIYTLGNGLRVYLAPRPEEPRISTAIVVRAGSKFDPPQATGLAHYLQHLMFQGTNKLGTLDYAREKPELDKIQALYELKRNIEDSLRRDSLSQQIDSISQIAAQYAIPREFTKLMADLGVQPSGANAREDRSLYFAEVPGNQLANWLKVEGERFRNPVFRRFNTVHEKVYEEKNQSWESDDTQARLALMEGLFPTHPYGQQPIMGSKAQLSTPSLREIEAYYQQYYVPNNMALCLSGDFDPDAAIRLIDQHFGYFENRRVKPVIFPPEKELPSPVLKEVSGPAAEYLLLGFRAPGRRSREALGLQMIHQLLSNGQAGLIDLNLRQKQQVGEASSSVTFLKEYSVHVLQASPREGQDLEEVKELLLQQIELLKQGDFEESLMEAVLNKLEVERMRSYEANAQRVNALAEAFATGQEWEAHCAELEALRSLDKGEIVELVNRLYQDNYVAVFKRQGKRPPFPNVTQPATLSLETPADTQSTFVKEMLAAQPPFRQPRFPDFPKEIQQQKLANGLSLHYMANQENALFSLEYTFAMGRQQDKELAFALEYLPYLGTDRYTAAELQTRFYELGSTLHTEAGSRQMQLRLTGLQAHFEESLTLLEDLLRNGRPDPAALEAKVAAELSQRESARQDQALLLTGLKEFALHGPRNPFTDRLSEEQLQELNPDQLLEKLQRLADYEHRIVYYGPDSLPRVAALLEQHHSLPGKMLPPPKSKPYPLLQPTENTLYFLQQESEQAEVLLLHRGTSFRMEYEPARELFNAYFGSLLVQFMEESQVQATGAQLLFQEADEKGIYYLEAHLSTLPDQLPGALAVLDSLLDSPPHSKPLLAASREAVQKEIESLSYPPAALLAAYEKALGLGLDQDSRATIYREVPEMHFWQLKEFYEAQTEDKARSILLLGDKQRLDLKELEQYGKLIELSPQDIFGY